MEKKQTAVEIFFNELVNLGYIEYSNDSLLQNRYKEAKEMEKKQIIDACNLQRNDYRGMPTYNKSGEQYYNDTYKSE